MRETELTPGLYIVATPIGNLADITLRAIDVLKRVEMIACEDTRVTSRLLSAHGISTRMTAYHEHNARRVLPRLVEAIRRGERVALVSDAGTPLISDPGYRLVAECAEAGLAVHPIPGASALLAGLVVAGLPTDRFLFQGFLPPKQTARRRELEELTPVPATLVFYESGPRLAAALADMAAVLGNRPATVARELTKLHEEAVRGPLPELAARYGDAPPPRGEMVVIVGPPAAPRTLDDAEIGERIRAHLPLMTRRDAVDLVTRETGIARKRVYALALALGDDG